MPAGPPCPDKLSVSILDDLKRQAPPLLAGLSQILPNPLFFPELLFSRASQEAPVTIAPVAVSGSSAVRVNKGFKSHGSSLWIVCVPCAACTPGSRHSQDALAAAVTDRLASAQTSLLC